jgi:surfeit locus 1 family protein
MHHKMKIKNWKLALLALLFICLFTSLGIWQVSRANQKKILLKSFAERTQLKPLSANHLAKPNDWRFYRISLQGNFDNQHTFLLDNKIFHGKVGYEVYTAFKASGLSAPILIDRGFIPMSTNRKELPEIPAIFGPVTLVGMLNLPPTYVALGEIYETPHITWPLRVEFINLPKLSKLIGQPLYSYVVILAPSDPAAFSSEWQIVTMSPERHMGYAVQWFALALTLLILFVALNRDRAKD